MLASDDVCEIFYRTRRAPALSPSPQAPRGAAPRGPHEADGLRGGALAAPLAAAAGAARPSGDRGRVVVRSPCGPHPPHPDAAGWWRTRATPSCWRLRTSRLGGGEGLGGCGAGGRNGWGRPSRGHRARWRGAQSRLRPRPGALRAPLTRTPPRVLCPVPRSARTRRWPRTARCCGAAPRTRRGALGGATSSAPRCLPARCPRAARPRSGTAPLAARGPRRANSFAPRPLLLTTPVPNKRLRGRWTRTASDGGPTRGCSRRDARV
jgi:hypothetical protein